MARFYAQVFTVVFFIVGVGGLFLGDASHLSGGHPSGNLGGLTLHLTWARDGLDITVLVVNALVGFVLGRRLGKLLVIILGAVLVALAVLGFAVGDDSQATRGVLGMHFPLALNLFDLGAGLLGVLAGLGTLSDEAIARGAAPLR